MSKKTPFNFVPDYLFHLNPVVKRMFGCYAIYIGDKIFLILRNREDHTDNNGIWLATKSEYHESLKKEFPSMTSISVLSEGKGETEWQMISSANDDFESAAIKLCEMILRGDERIGRIPQKKKSNQ